MTKLFEAIPFIIAEIGSNWTSLQDCAESIALAKKCGADAVKFQAFDHQSLYGSRGSDFLIPIGSNGEYRSAEQLFGRGVLNIDWLPKLKEKADACDIELMCTAFSPELVDAVDPFVKVHKIASSDLSYPQLLHKVKSKGKPILLSCGASSKGDVQLALNALEGANVVLMYCNAAYPSYEHNLFKMKMLTEATGKPVGFSDHSLDVIYAPLSAVKHFGAVAVEKHLNVMGVDSPDAGHSLSTDQFKIMCDFLHGKRDASEFNPSSEEKEMFLRHNRRLIAIQDLLPGAILKFGQNYGAYRSLEDDSHGLSPFYWQELEGKQLTKAVKAGKGVSMSDVK